MLPARMHQRLAALRTHTSAALRTAGSWAADGVTRLRARAGENSSHALAAGGVRTVAAALEVATGPLGGALVAAGAEAAVLAIATDAVRRAATARNPDADLAAVLGRVIGELARDELCEAHVADGWRAACGVAAASRAAPALAVGLRRAVLQAALSRATTVTLRKAGLKKLLWVGQVVALARLPAELRRTCALVRRAEARARAAAANVGVASAA